MTIKQIKKAINNVLIQNGCDVYSSETEDGFKKPAYFVDVFPISRDRTNSFYEEIKLSVEIQYEPLIETVEECIERADDILKWFTVPIEAEERKITAYNSEFSTDDTVLYATFDIEFMQLIGDSIPDIEDMEILKIQEGVNKNGITRN